MNYVTDLFVCSSSFFPSLPDKNLHVHFFTPHVPEMIRISAKLITLPHLIPPGPKYWEEVLLSLNLKHSFLFSSYPAGDSQISIYKVRQQEQRNSTESPADTVRQNILFPLSHKKYFTKTIYSAEWHWQMTYSQKNVFV